MHEEEKNRTEKIAFYIFFTKYLVMSKKSSNFACYL